MSKKTKKRAVFERLKAREIFSEVRKEEGSGSAVYEGLRMYLDWVEPRVGALQSQLADLEHGVEETGEEHAKVLGEIKEAARKRDELSRAGLSQNS